VRHLLLLLPLALSACSSPAAPLPADATSVSVHPLVDGSGDKMRARETGERLCCLGPRLLDQERLASVDVVKGDLGMPEIRMVLDEEGHELLTRHASEHTGERLAILVGGELWVAPLVHPALELRWLALRVKDPVGAIDVAEEVATGLRAGVGKASPAP
jgi:hypothetical protein